MVIVFGGTGFVGKNLQEIRPEWMYVGREKIIENGIEYKWNLDLTDEQSLRDFFEKFSFDDFSVLNLAADVGGIFYNMKNQHSIMYKNIEMNKNVFKLSKEFGVNKIISTLSTCAWPDKLESYPFNEDDLFKGPPPFSNGGYAHAKRLMFFEHLLAREEGFNSVCFAPCNLYGPHDRMGESSHLISAITDKMLRAKKGDIVTLKGNGLPRRQHLHVEDLCHVVSKFIVPEYEADDPLLVTHPENKSISEIAEIIRSSVGVDVVIEFEGDECGQMRKDGSSKMFYSLFEFKPRSFEDGILEFVKWSRKQH